jgi:hypothetical protein
MKTCILMLQHCQIFNKIGVINYGQRNYQIFVYSIQKFQIKDVKYSQLSINTPLGLDP